MNNLTAAIKTVSLLVLLFASGLFTETYAQTPEQKIADMGMVLSSPPAPMANYVRAVRTGNLVFLSGHGPSKPDGGLVQGKVGQSITLEEGKEAARLTGIALLSSLKAEIQDLSKVKRIVKVLGMVNATPDFTQHPMVINGFSDFMIAVFGEKGKHARSAIGVASLPSNMAVEIEMIVEIED
jgi:enamine deaminase RidA (YjgF/YER057c/UK114 family)